MPELIWDAIGDRTYETGVDRGVLYLPDGTAIPWNGLTAVIEAFDKESSPVYYDGMKISELVSFGDFSGSMKALTYPEEFASIEGLGQARPGVFYGDQPSKAFGLCYRTQVGNDVDGEAAGHKVHILFNVVALPNDKSYVTTSTDPSPVEFEWSIKAVPEEVPGFRHTAHIILDTRYVDPWLLEELESILYGSSNADAALIPMQDLVTYVAEWYRIKIIDNGDGTWTAISQREGLIEFGLNDFFEIFGANAIYLNEYTFVISDTSDISDLQEINIVDNGDGTWTAYSSEETNIVVIDAIEQIVEIRNANIHIVDEDEYRISNTAD